MEEYLQSLYRELRVYFNNREAVVIVNDYREYFEMGILDGKNADELIAQFGGPKKLVNELMSDKVQLRESSAAFIRLKGVVIKILYCLLIAVLLFWGHRYGGNIAVGVLVVLAAPSLALYWAINNYSPISYFEAEKIGIIRKLCFIPLAAGIFYWLYCKGWFVYSKGWFVYKSVSEFNNDIPSDIATQIGPSLLGNLVLVRLAALTLILLFFFMRNSKLYYRKQTLFFVFLGFIQTVNSLVFALSDLNDFREFKAAFTRSFIPLTVGAAAAIVSYICIRAIDKRKGR